MPEIPVIVVQPVGPLACLDAANWGVVTRYVLTMRRELCASVLALGHALPSPCLASDDGAPPKGAP